MRGLIREICRVVGVLVLTINPSDMNDPLVIRLAGVNFPQ